MFRTIGSAISLSILLVACGGGATGGGSETVGSGTGGSGTGGSGTGGAIAAPSGLQYTASDNFGHIFGEVGQLFGPDRPIVIGTVNAYSVMPALPAGLTLDPTTGVISGTPLASTPESTYTITASNEAGATTVTLNVVILVPPTDLAYAGPVTGSVGTAVLPLIPSFSGDASGFQVLPPLPAGLVLDQATGTLSGTPSRARPATTYVVIASNVGGAYTTAELHLAIDAPPAGTAMTGVFRSDTVTGLGYASGAHRDYTDDSGGFTYDEGQGIEFYVGQVVIGRVPTAKSLVTPVDLVVQGTGISNRVLNVERFLLMLDEDGNANNGIQISAAVTAAAAQWPPVDFDTTDLPTTLAPLILQASAADGKSHSLPDAATAQSHLRAAFYCTRWGSYYGTYGAESTPEARGSFNASVFPDGSMHAYASGTLLGLSNFNIPAGFDVHADTAVSPMLDGSIALSVASPSVSLQGSFADATYLSGTYLADFAGNFQALGDTSVGATYKFAGHTTPTFYNPSGSISFLMDDSNQVSEVNGGIAGRVSGNTFTGTVRYNPNPYGHGAGVIAPVSGTYSNTAAGVKLEGRYTTNLGVMTFSTVGCRAN